MPDPDQPAPNPTNPWDDLLCPNCDYSLRGLPAPRCPECGTVMTAQQLRDLDRPVPRPAMPWDRRAGIVSYLKTWWLVATSPGRVARGFPAVPMAENARRYARVSTFAAILTFVVCNLRLFWIRPESLFPVLFGFTIASIFAYEACESLLAELLTKCARPPRARAATIYWYWHGVLQYHGGFKPLLVAGACVGLHAIGAPRMSNAATYQLMAACMTCVAVVVWWMVSVVTMARQWARGPTDVANAIAFVVVAILIAAFVFWLLLALFASLGFAVAGLLRRV